MKSLLEIMDDVLSQMSDEEFNEIWETVDKRCAHSITVDDYLNMMNSLGEDCIYSVNEPNFNYKINFKYINVPVVSSEQALAA